MAVTILYDQLQDLGDILSSSLAEDETQFGTILGQEADPLKTNGPILDLALSIVQHIRKLDDHEAMDVAGEEVRMIK